MKKLNVKKMKIVFNFETFRKNHPTTRPIKYKVTNFAFSNISIMVNNLPSTNLEQFLGRIKSPLTCW